MSPGRLVANAAYVLWILGISGGRIVFDQAQPSAQREGVDRQPGTLATDFLAVSTDGTPVRNLTADDLRITVGGKLRVIRSLELISDVAAVNHTVATPIPGETTLLPVPFATNLRSGGRTFYLVLDHQSIVDATDRMAAQSLPTAVEAMSAALAPADEIALAPVDPSEPVLQPTTNHESVRAGLADVLGRPVAKGSATLARASSQRCLSRLATLLDALADSDESPIVIVLSGELSSAVGSNAHQGSVGAARSASNRPEIQATESFARLRAAAARARSILYFVPIVDAVPSVTNTRLDGLQQIAAALDAGFLALGRTDQALVQIVRETSARYHLVLTSEVTDRPGEIPPLTISTLRLGVTIRAAAEIAGRAPFEARAPSVEQLLASADEARAVAIRAAAFVTRAETHPSGGLRVTAAIESVDPTTRLIATGAALVDAAGRTVAADRPVSGALAALLTRSQMVAPPGHYDLRVAVVDDAGRAGAVDTPLDLALVSAGSLSLGTLVLGLPAQSTSPSKPGRAQVATRPAVRLEFDEQAEAIAFFDLYGGSANERISVEMEVVRRPDGPPVQEIQPQIQPARAGEPDHYLVTAPIDLARLAPGDYLVRATVSVPGQRPGILTRTLRKTRRGS